MIWLIIGIVAWLMFGYFAARIAILEGMGYGFAWLMLCFGPISWMTCSIMCLNHFKKAHFIPSIPTPRFVKYFKNKHGSFNKMLFRA
jgi:hypothetical protein